MKNQTREMLQWMWISLSQTKSKIMKVICVKTDSSNGELRTLLQTGSIYDARQCYMYPCAYILNQIPVDPFDGKPVSFMKKLFAPLNGPCEVAILEERVEQEIANLDKSYQDLVHEVENA